MSQRINPDRGAQGVEDVAIRQKLSEARALLGRAPGLLLDFGGDTEVPEILILKGGVEIPDQDDRLLLGVHVGAGGAIGGE